MFSRQFRLGSGGGGYFVLYIVRAYERNRTESNYILSNVASSEQTNRLIKLRHRFGFCGFGDGAVQDITCSVRDILA